MTPVGNCRNGSVLRRVGAGGVVRPSPGGYRATAGRRIRRHRIRATAVPIGEDE